MTNHTCDQTDKLIEKNDFSIVPNVMFPANGLQPSVEAMKISELIRDKHFSSLTAMADWIKANCQGM